MPLRPRHGYAAALHRGLPTDDLNRPRSSPLRDEGAGTRRYASPHRPGWSWRSALERRSAAGSSRTPSRLASRTRAVRSCRRVPSLSGLLAALPGVSQVGLPPASPGCCDSRAEKVLHLLSVAGASWRSMSHDHTAFGLVASSSGLAAGGCVA
jgi:hypothetical protein